MAEQETDKSPAEGVGEAPSYVTKDQLTATVAYFSQLIKESAAQSVAAFEAKAETKPEATPVSDEIQALRAQLQKFEQQQHDQQVRSSALDAISKTGIDPLALDVILPSIGSRLQSGEAGLYLKTDQGVTLFSDYLAEFRATPLGSRFVANDQKPQATKTPIRAAVGKEEKPDVGQMLMQALGFSA